MSSGLLVVLALTIATLLVGTVVPLSPLTLGLLFGLLAGNLVTLPSAIAPGIEVASKYALRAGIVLLGFRLSLADITDLGFIGLAVIVTQCAVTYMGARWLGARLGASKDLSQLVGAGYAICGLSAVAAVNSVVEAEESEVAYAMGLVTLAGSASIVLFPLLARLMDLDVQEFGSWVGAGVHDVAQTVATASFVEGALGVAIVVKLTRVTLLAPLVFIVSWARNRSTPSSERRVQAVPFFILAFLAVVVTGSIVSFPNDFLGAAGGVERFLLTGALVAVGTGVRLGDLRRLGGMPLALGMTAWVLVGGAALLTATVLLQ